jgi:anti-anti-sigma factor
MNHDDIELEQIGDVPIVSVSGDIDAAKAELLDRAINVLDAENAIVVSFEDSSSVDSAAVVTMLLRRNEQLRGNLVALVPKTSALRAYIERSARSSSLHVVDTREDALTIARGLKRIVETEVSKDGVGSRSHS